MSEPPAEYTRTVCEQCGANFDSESDPLRSLRAHLKTEHEIQVCSRCGKTFPTPMQLRTHRRGEHGFTRYNSEKLDFDQTDLVNMYLKLDRELEKHKKGASVYGWNHDDNFLGMFYKPTRHRENDSYSGKYLTIDVRACRALLALLSVSGRRITEIIRMKRSAVVLQDGRLLLTFDTLKRRKPLPPVTKTIVVDTPQLKEYQDDILAQRDRQDYPTTEWLFPAPKRRGLTHLSRVVAWYWVSYLSDGVLSPHKSRHHLVTEMIRKGVPLLEIQHWFNWTHMGSMGDYEHVADTGENVWHILNSGLEKVGESNGVNSERGPVSEVASNPSSEPVAPQPRPTGLPQQPQPPEPVQPERPSRNIFAAKLKLKMPLEDRIDVSDSE